MANEPERIYEFIGVTGDVTGWIEREGLAIRIVIKDDEDGESDTVNIEFPADLAGDVAEALHVASDTS